MFTIITSFVVMHLDNIPLLICMFTIILPRMIIINYDYYSNFIDNCFILSCLVVVLLLLLLIMIGNRFPRLHYISNDDTSASIILEKYKTRHNTRPWWVEWVDKEVSENNE